MRNSTYMCHGTYMDMVCGYDVDHYFLQKEKIIDNKYIPFMVGAVRLIIINTWVIITRRGKLV